MKRELDLSRSILAFVEEHSSPQAGLNKPLEFQGYDRATVLAHAELLIEEGLLHGKADRNPKGGGPPEVGPPVSCDSSVDRELMPTPA